MWASYMYTYMYHLHKYRYMYTRTCTCSQESIIKCLPLPDVCRAVGFASYYRLLVNNICTNMQATCLVHQLHNDQLQNVIELIHLVNTRHQVVQGSVLRKGHVTVT